MDKEVLATTAVKDSISWTDRLKPYIPEKDKEPIWDGSVYVYSTAEPSNDTCLGRVPTQVKGTEVEDFQEYETFDVPLSSLRQFLAEGGVIFFVVEISKLAEDKRIFFNSLLPYDIILLLDACEDDQKTKRIRLQPFPHDNDEKVDIFVNFLQNREKHRTISGLKRIIPIEELLKKDQTFDLTISYSSSKASEFPEYALDHELYVYFNDSNGVTFPIQHLTNISEVGASVDATIYCGETPFNIKMTEIRRKGEREVILGKALHFFTTEDESKSRFIFHLTGTLEDRIHDCELAINLLQTGGFLFESKFHKVSIDNLDGEWLAKVGSFLSYLRKIKAGLEYMGAVVPLDLDTLTEKDWNRINNLLIPASEGKAVFVEGLTDTREIRVLEIGNLKLKIFAVKQESGKYLLSNFFAAPLCFVIRDQNEALIPCCYYVAMHKQELVSLSNIDFTLMLRRVIAEEPHPVYVGEVNHLLLQLLDAYDDTKRDEILSASISLSEWLYSLADDAIGAINHLQAIKRKRPFRDDEKKRLLRIAYDPTTPNVCKMGANILLEDYQSAESQYNCLTQEERSQYENFPIMTLWRRL